MHLFELVAVIELAEVVITARAAPKVVAMVEVIVAAIVKAVAIPMAAMVNLKAEVVLAWAF